MTELFDMETHLLAAMSAGANAAAYVDDDDMARELTRTTNEALRACHAAMHKLDLLRESRDGR